MGIAKYMKGEHELAFFYLLRALKSEEEAKKWVTNYFAALSLFELKRYKEAIPFFQKVISEKKALPESMFKMGVCLKNLGDAESAIKLFNSVIEMEPSRSEAYLEIIKIYDDKKMLKEAFSVVEKGLTVFPDHPIFIYEKAKLLFKTGRANEAEKELERAMKLSKDHNITKFYSSIIKAKKIPEKPAEKTELKGVKPVFKNIFLALIGFVSISVIIFLLFLHRKNKNALPDKLLYLNELLNKGDLYGVRELLDELKDRIDLSVPLTKFYVLMADKERAYESCGTVKNDKKRQLLEGYLYIYFDDKERFKKHLAILESLDAKETMDLLKKHSFESKDLVRGYILLIE